MADSFAGHSDSVIAPSRRAVAVTPSDSVALTDTPKGIWVGTGGDITGRLVNDVADIVWKNVPSGALLPFRFALIKATGTTAADIVAHY